MELSYTYKKILDVAKEIKKMGIKIGQLVEIVQYIFSDENVLHVFVRIGGGYSKNEDAINAICEEMENGKDFFEIQQDVLRALIAANFYKKELQEMLNTLNKEETPTK